MTSYLTPEQYALLMDSRGIHKDRVAARDGYAYVEAHDIKAAMIRVFGFERWSWKINSHTIQREAETITKSTNKPAWAITAVVHGTLTVCAPDGTHLATYDGVHAGSSTHPEYGEAVGNAVTNADSYAFKRAAIMALGTQGGLGLYNRGSRAEIVRWTLVKPPKPETGEQGDAKHEDAPNTDDIPQVHQESLELPDPGPDPRSTSTQPAATPPPTPAVTAAPEPAAGGESSPPPAADPPTSKAAEIRALAVGDPPAEYQGRPAKWIAHLMGLAVKSGDLQTPVESLTSPTQVPLKLLLEEALKFATAPATPRERSA